MSFNKVFPRYHSTVELTLEEFHTTKVGKGSYGTVYKAVHKQTGKVYAIKELDKTKRDVIKSVPYELIMYTLNCQHIVQLYDHFETKETVSLVLEFIEGKELFNDIIRNKIRLSHKEIAKIIYQLCIAVLYIHSRGIVHRDIKPDNILIDGNGRVKLTDFGTANEISESHPRRTCIGTPLYISPEVLNGDDQTTAVDVWAIGAIIYELITLKAAFRGLSKQDVLQSVKDVSYQLPPCIQDQKDLKDLITSIFVLEVQKRLTVVQIMEHPWIRTNMGTQYAQYQMRRGKDAQVQSHESQVQGMDWSQSKELLLGQIEDLEAQVLEGRAKRSSEDILLATRQDKVVKFQNQVDKIKKKTEDKILITAANLTHMEQLESQLNSDIDVLQNYQKMAEEVNNRICELAVVDDEKKTLKSREAQLLEQISMCKSKSRIGPGGKSEHLRVLTDQLDQKPKQTLTQVETSLKEIENFLSAIREKRRAPSKEVQIILE